MTQTIATIVNAFLAAGIVTGLFLVMRIPFHLRRPRSLSRAVYAPPADGRELAKAA